ncbi:hypothetical protein T265_06226 [Opisthorchis viverrini]|uniref:Uncharacterized protein n=1 Tax=Opisthorchis viverrini TaxID=6198 RepID=A0A075AEA0_OPIVI|nr:hypothetical protein T265_06226 [Opisthorchis viverrini]KER26584.1 hypothetical protein T265_06226 [Opisthorchis viverrini]
MELCGNPDCLSKNRVPENNVSLNQWINSSLSYSMSYTRYICKLFVCVSWRMEYSNGDPTSYRVRPMMSVCAKRWGDCTGTKEKPDKFEITYGKQQLVLQVKHVSNPRVGCKYRQIHSTKRWNTGAVDCFLLLVFLGNDTCQLQAGQLQDRRTPKLATVTPKGGAEKKSIDDGKRDQMQCREIGQQLLSMN